MYFPILADGGSQGSRRGRNPREPHRGVQKWKYISRPGIISTVTWKDGPELTALESLEVSSLKRIHFASFGPQW
jgi:hypothetical protein